MNALDILILIMVISSLVRGFDIGMSRQLFSTAGFIGGLFLGAYLEHFTVRLGHTPLSRSMITLATTLGLALVFLSVGELAGGRLKHRLQLSAGLNKVDSWLGSALAAVTLVVAVWLAAAVIVAFPAANVQQQIRGSLVLSALNHKLPAAPDVIAGLGSLIDPNGFPQVFTGNEPDQTGNTTVPGISPALQAAIDKSTASTVKLEGLGCGGIVDGSGFVAARDLVITNAHVVAGVRQPYVKDTNGQHSASVIWFDPGLDIAVVRAQNLAGPPLLLAGSPANKHSLAAVLGYPGGGNLQAGGAEVLDDFTARGRDIYGQGVTERDVYSLAATVIPGNSGGPLIAVDGSVIGVIFAESTAYQNVGYALSSPQIQAVLSQAQAQNRAVSSGSCAE